MAVLIDYESYIEFQCDEALVALASRMIVY